MPFQGSNNYDTKSLTYFANAAAINEKIGPNVEDLNEILDLLVVKLKNLNIDELIRFLKDKKQTTDQSYKKQNVAVSTFSGISAVGGALMLAGTAGALVTLGASLGFVLAGGVTVGIGTFGSVTAQIAGKIRRKLIIRDCKKKVEKMKSDTEEIGKIYEEFCNKCIGVSMALEQFELNVESLKELDPVIFKFAMIGWLNAPKVAIAAGATAAGTHVVRSSSVAAHISNFVHIRFLGKAIFPALKLTQAILGIGMAITGVGIAFDLVVGGKALYDLVKGNRCSESNNLSCAIKKAEEHAKVIKSYIQLLEHDAADLLQKAIDSTRTIGQQIADQANAIDQLKRTNDEKAALIEELRRADDEKTAEIEQMRRENDSNFKSLRYQIEMLQQQFNKK